jgi:hypothetical protein
MKRTRLVQVASELFLRPLKYTGVGVDDAKLVG